MPFKVELNITVSDERVSDLLCCALKGGSNYWYRIDGFRKPKGKVFQSWKGKTFRPLDYPLSKGGAITISSLEEYDTADVILDRAALQRGLQLMAESAAKGKDYAGQWAAFMREEEDGDTGDVFLQFCVFGEVKYS
jgi:hypothetical protein